MSKSKVVLIAGIGMALAGASYWAARPAPREWSTVDPAALAELEQGRSAMEKLYHLEAVEHFRAALTHDPEFFAARIMLAEALYSTNQPGAANAERERALKADPETLTPREQRSWRLSDLRRKEKFEEVYRLLERYAEENPRDPEITRGMAQQSFGRGDLDAALKWSEATLAVARNDALSYNTLGYVEMGRGNFAAAEANLRRYAFIAPDQANPHDSLGELYTVTGRWDDAERELRRALELNPRFFPSWDHLARVAALRGDEGAAIEATRRALELAGVGPPKSESRVAEIRAYCALSRGDYEAIRGILAGVKEKPAIGDLALLEAVAASAAGEVERVQTMVAEAERAFEKLPDMARKGPGRSMLDLMRVVSLLAEGKAGEAASLAGSSEARLSFSIEEAIIKLLLRCYQVEALDSSGQDAEARKVLTSIEAVNPNFPCVASCRERLDRL